jgi:hypothetical protein
MTRLIPAVAIAALLAGSAAVAQTTTPPGDIAPNPASPGATSPAPTATPPAVQPLPPTGERLAPTASTEATSAPTMTEEEAKQWVDKAVYSSDDSNIGSIAAIQRDASGKITEIHADIGGFLGLGATRVRLQPSQFQLSGDRVVLNVTSEQAKQLPKVAD